MSETKRAGIINEVASPATTGVIVWNRCKNVTSWLTAGTTSGQVIGDSIDNIMLTFKVVVSMNDNLVIASLGTIPTMRWNFALIAVNDYVPGSHVFVPAPAAWYTSYDPWREMFEGNEVTVIKKWKSVKFNWGPQLLATGTPQGYGNWIASRTLKAKLRGKKKFEDSLDASGTTGSPLKGWNYYIVISHGTLSAVVPPGFTTPAVIVDSYVYYKDL